MSCCVTTLENQLLVRSDGSSGTQLSTEELEHMLLTPMNQVTDIRKVGEDNLL